jgi:excisionase family DNA binding protein
MLSTDLLDLGTIRAEKAFVVTVKMQPNPPPPEASNAYHPILTKAELAAYFKVTERTIEKLQKSGVINSIKLGRAVRYNVRQVEAALSSGSD